MEQVWELIPQEFEFLISYFVFYQESEFRLQFLHLVNF